MSHRPSARQHSDRKTARRPLLEWPVQAVSRPAPLQMVVRHQNFDPRSKPHQRKGRSHHGDGSDKEMGRNGMSAFLKTTPPNLGAFKSLFSFVMWHVRNHTKIIRSNRLIREFCVLFPAPQHTRHPLRGTSLGATGSSLNLRRYLDLDSLSKSSIKIFENFAQR